jgi:hypothetical protein
MYINISIKTYVDSSKYVEIYEYMCIYTCIYIHIYVHMYVSIWKDKDLLFKNFWEQPGTYEYAWIFCIWFSLL